MNRLKVKGVPVYRTDENGTVVATSNGTKISFNVKQGSYNGVISSSTSSSSSSSNNSTNKTAPTVVAMPKANTTGQNQSITVYTTRTGSKYHVAGCSSLSKSKIPIRLSDAKSTGLTPCSKCKPPE